MLIEAGDKTLDEYDFAFQPDLDPRKIRNLATLAFVQAKANVALLGPPGVGKTHIAVALAVAACRAGFTVYFTSLDDMVRHLTATDDIGRLACKLHTYLRPNVLVIDEVGYQPLDARRGGRAQPHGQRGNQSPVGRLRSSPGAVAGRSRSGHRPQ